MACSQEVRRSLPQLAASVHAAVGSLCDELRSSRNRSVHVIPKSYLNFLEGFVSLYGSRLSSAREQEASVRVGLAKMAQAKVDVAEMRTELSAKETKLVAAGEAAEALLADISASTAAAEREKASVQTIVESVTAQAQAIAVVKDGAARDLAAAKPALDAALAALSSITPKDIGALKALKNPPDVIKRIFDCVLLLRWGEGERGRRGRGRDARGRAPTQHPPSDPFIAASPSRAPPGKTSRVPWCSKATTRPRCA